MKTTSPLIVIAIAGATLGLTSCGKQTGTSQADRTANALASYVAPGEKDEYYLFYSGGHSGQVFVAGIPSLRHITTIPVFAHIRPPVMGSTRNQEKCWATSLGAMYIIRRCRKPIQGTMGVGSS